MKTNPMKPPCAASHKPKMNNPLKHMEASSPLKTKSTLMKTVANVTLSIALLAFAACSTDTKQKTADQADHDTTAHAETSASAPKPAFEDPKAAAVYEHYLHLKNALVEGNSKEAQSGAAALQTALSDAGNSRGADQAGKIASASDLSAQRTELEALTAEVESVLKASKMTAGVVYKQYCPMANDNKGGYWLSSDSEIKNPYFGDEMLTCGETKEEIK